MKLPISCKRSHPEHPALAIIGGAKFETKEPLLQKLLSAYDKVLLGGALGNDLLKARGIPVGASLVAEMMAPTSLAGEVRLWLLLTSWSQGERCVASRGSTYSHTGDVRAGENR